MSGGEREIFFGLMKRSGMAGKNFLRKAEPSLDSQAGCACLSPGEWTQTGDTGTRGKEQAPAATTKSAGAKRRCPAECRQSFAEQAANREDAERKCGRRVSAARFSRRRRRAVFRGAARRGQVPRRLNVSSDGYSENGGRYLGIRECSPWQRLPDVRQGLQRLLLTRPVQTYARQNPARLKQS